MIAFTILLLRMNGIFVRLTEGFIPIKFLVYMLTKCCKQQFSEDSNSDILFSTRALLSLCLLVDNSGDFEQWASISPIKWALFFNKVHSDIAKGDRSVLDVYLREANVQPLVRTMLFDVSCVTHLRNKKRHVFRPFSGAIQEKRYNLQPVMVCGLILKG